MKFSVEIKGLDKLNKRLDKIIKKLPNAMEKGIMEAIRQTAQLIIVQTPVNTGNLKGSIKYEILNADTNEVKGRVYSDVNIAPYALWVNYGTGLYAEGEGGSRASKIPWFVHTSMADLSKYNYEIFTAPDGNQFYIIYGQPATHFFDSAEFIMRDDNVQAVAREIQAIMEG